MKTRTRRAALAIAFAATLPLGSACESVSGIRPASEAAFCDEYEPVYLTDAERGTLRPSTLLVIDGNNAVALELGCVSGDL